MVLRSELLMAGLATVFYTCDLLGRLVSSRHLVWSGYVDLISVQPQRANSSMINYTFWGYRSRQIYGHCLTWVLLSRMWTLPEASEVAIPNERRVKDAEPMAGDCNIRKVIYFFFPFVNSWKYFQHLNVTWCLFRYQIKCQLSIFETMVSCGSIDCDSNLCPYGTRFKENPITKTYYTSQILSTMDSMWCTDWSYMNSFPLIWFRDSFKEVVSNWGWTGFWQDFR